ncbi:MAG TPA: hypothetical protein VKB61_06880 [Candidatus Acidoferrum sp.]|jgi:hypothetical protein|nr:hypothetical protein [Candidatus Acidoferrum sp.]
MFRPLALALLACLLHSCPLLAQARPASQANPALEEFKTLAGEWEGKDSHGGNVHVSYEVMSSGVVMERLQPEGGPGMMTMYSLDEDHIVAFHFCSEGNQPVLKTDTLSAATGKYNFTIERAYGLKTTGDLHMVGLLVTISDRDHLTQVWTNLHDGKRSSNTITLARRK